MDPIAESTPSTPSTLLARPALNAEEASEVVQRVRRAQAGDLAAYDQLVHQFQERIYGLCYHMTSHHEDAHDLAQDTFVKAWQALKNFKGDSSFYTWIYRIAVNTCLNHLSSAGIAPSISVSMIWISSQRTIPTWWLWSRTRLLGVKPILQNFSVG